MYWLLQVLQTNTSNFTHAVKKTFADQNRSKSYCSIMLTDQHHQPFQLSHNTHGHRPRLIKIIPTHTPKKHWITQTRPSELNCKSTVDHMARWRRAETQSGRYGIVRGAGDMTGGLPSYPKPYPGVARSTLSPSFSPSSSIRCFSSAWLPLATNLTSSSLLVMATAAWAPSLLISYYKLL